MNVKSARWMVGLCVAAALGAGGRCAAATEPSEPFLAAYINIDKLFDAKAEPAQREQSIARHVERFRGCGLRVLMPFVVDTRKQALYPSRVIADKPYHDWDPLAVIMREARSRQLKVYPAICVMASGGDHPAGILKTHPDWAVRDAAGKPLGFISAGHPEARKWIVDLVHEVAAQYQPDGLLLDYLRFPSGSAQLDAVSQAQFDTAHPAAKLPRDGSPYRHQLLQFKRECLTELVGQIVAAVRSVKPQPRIALYMWGPQELSGTRDWPTWVQRGYIDVLNLSGYCYQANYGPSYMQVYEKRIRDVAAILKKAGQPIEFTVCVGIDTSHGHISSAAEIRQYLQVAKRSGAQGAAIFTWDTLQPYLDEVDRGRYIAEFAAKE